MTSDQKTTVLLLDDEPIVCKRLKPSLEKAGYDVEAFTKSREAMHRLTEKEFDIAIPDDQAEKISTVGDAIAYIENNTK